MHDPNLTQFKDGTELTVCEVLGDGPIPNRLREIGMIPGARLRIVRQGSPMIVEIGHSRFCLRGNEAALVKVNTFDNRTDSAVPVAQIPSTEQCML